LRGNRDVIIYMSFFSDGRDGASEARFWVVLREDCPRAHVRNGRRGRRQLVVNLVVVFRCVLIM
jgi:hypothetical protein